GFQVAERLDLLLPLGAGRFGLRIGPAQGAGPGGDTNARFGGARTGDATGRGELTESLPDLLGQERHHWVEQPAERVQDRGHHALGDRAGARITEPRLDELDVPVAKLSPGELTEPPGCLGEPECLQVG